jgi:hypothetical protein
LSSWRAGGETGEPCYSAVKVASGMIRASGLNSAKGRERMSHPRIGLVEKKRVLISSRAEKIVSPLRGLRELGMGTQGFRPGLDCAAPPGLPGDAPTLAGYNSREICGAIFAEAIFL